MLKAYDLCGHGPFEIQKLWAPGPPDSNPWFGCPRDEYHNTQFDFHAQKFYHAAVALAQIPQAQDDEELQRTICANHGIVFDCMTENERQHLYALANEFMGV